MICAHRCEPDYEAECYEAINSQGAACQSCTADCYRKGWDKLAVTFDNAALVRINHSKVLTDSHIAEYNEFPRASPCLDCDSDPCICAREM